jgi:hypothetical protein
MQAYGAILDFRTIPFNRNLGYFAKIGGAGSPHALFLLQGGKYFRKYFE